MEVHCIRCRRRISRQFLDNHQRGKKCDRDTDARVLLSPPYNAVPYPIGHDLPDCIPHTVHVTRARYEGQRLDESGAVIPNGKGGRKGSNRGFGRQVWVSAWVRTVESAWARLSLAHKNRRDRLLCALHKLRNSELNTLFTRPGRTDEGVIALARALTGES